MTNELVAALARFAPAIATTRGLTPQQQLDRATEWAARAECLIEVTEQELERKADRDGIDIEEVIKSDGADLGLIYAVAAIMRAQLANATVNVEQASA